MRTKKLMEKYELFGRLMTEDKIYEDPSMDFKKACALAGIRPCVLDRLLKKELGVNGNELLDNYRKGDTQPPLSC